MQHMGMEQSPEQVIIQVQQDLEEVKRDLEELSRFVRGNGDPSKGLLWLVADQARLIAGLSAMHEANRALIEQYHQEQKKAFESHEQEGHYHRQSAAQRLAFQVGSQVLGVVVSVSLLVLLWGLQTWIRCTSGALGC